MSLTKATYAMISGAPANVLDYGADSTGVADSSAAFNDAFAIANIVYVPQGSYKLITKITIPPYGQVIGAGINNTLITATQQSFVLQYWSQLRNLKIVGATGHATNLVEVGSATLDAGRAVISDVWVQGAGADGIQLIYGNLGLLQNVTSIINGLNGIRFLAGSGDLNAWTTQGYIDLRSNGNDGFRVEGGTSLSDPLCSKSNFFNNITAQENTQYGVYIGTRSNIVSSYSEANGVSDVVLGTYARGNEVTTVQGSVADYSSNPSFNLVSNYNGTAGYQRLFQNRTLFSGKSGTGLEIYNDDDTAGTLSFSKTAERAFALTGNNSSGDFTLAIKNAAAPSAYITTTFGGNTQPDTDNTFNLGGSSYRWATVYAATGTINTSDEREKQDIAALSDAEKRVAVKLKGLIRKFKFRDAVAAKGVEARIHVGVVAQDVAKAFESEGLNANDYGVFCCDEWPEQPEKRDGKGNIVVPHKPAGSRYGVRYEELLAFIIAV